MKELVEVHVDGAVDVGDVIAISIQGCILIDQDWSSLWGSYWVVVSRDSSHVSMVGVVISIILKIGSRCLRLCVCRRDSWNRPSYHQNRSRRDLNRPG